jgi:hypothetical protein
VQEVYAWLLGHWTVRVLMFQAATSAGVAPLRLSFTTLRVIRCAIPKFQRLNCWRRPRALSPDGLNRRSPRLLVTLLRLPLSATD